MARKTILVDDVDGTEGADIKTVDFSIEGKAFEIDLNLKNRSKLQDTLAPFMAAARRPTSPVKASKPAATAASGEQRKAIMDWANANGFNVSDRGRVAKDVVDAFEASHAKTPAKTPAKKTPAPEPALSGV